MNHPRSFCIYLKNSNYSLKKLSDVIETGKKFNWNIEPFVGVVGDTVNWSIENIKPSEEKKFQTRKGAQGCFMSHYHLWNLCLKIKESIIIFEHDIIFIDSWKDNINLSADVIKLYKPLKSKQDKFTGLWQIGTHGYLITPVGAEKLISWCKSNFAYHTDMLIGSNILIWKNLDKDLIKLSDENLSTTRYKVL
jgi:GR25 family glycosyltransferase involved in LPS biosynthesis